MNGKRCRVLVALVLTASGCGSILDIPEAPRLEEEGGPWQCLSAPLERAAPDQSLATVTVYACDFVQSCASAVTGLTARLCAKRDVDCTNPLREGIRDVEGTLTFEVPTANGGFDGYLEVVAPSALCNDRAVFGAASDTLCQLLERCDPENVTVETCSFPTYVRSLLFFNPPVTASVPAPLQLPMLSSPGLPSVVQAAGAPLDPTTGNLFITALDCAGQPVAGVTYSISQHQDKVTQLYVDNGVVSDTRLETDASGIGGFVGVPPGFAEVIAYNEDLEEIGSIGVQAAPFTMTYSAMVPTPRAE